MGPTILLAPATTVVAKTMQKGPVTFTGNSKVTIFHGDVDDTISLSDSQEFVKLNPHVKLIICNNEDHQLVGIAENLMLSKEIKELLE